MLFRKFAAVEYQELPKQFKVYLDGGIEYFLPYGITVSAALHELKTCAGSHGGHFQNLKGEHLDSQFILAWTEIQPQPPYIYVPRLQGKIYQRCLHLISRFVIFC